MSLTKVSYSMVNGAPVNVLDFGADPSGVANSSAAFAAAWAAIKAAGGTVYIPPGTYKLNSMWVCDVSLTASRPYKIVGYGVEITYGGTLTTDWSINVVGAFVPSGVTIEGLRFNHADNIYVAGAIKATGAGYLKILRCSAEVNNNNANYSSIYLDTNTYWTEINGFVIRLGGAQTVKAPNGIALIGQANATKIVNSSFGGVTNGVFIGPDVSGNMVNGLRILSNDFEGVTNCVTISTASPSTTTPAGVFLAFNRVESVTSFITWTGVFVAESAQPLISQSNYLTTGSVSAYFSNPNNQIMFIMESSYYGVGTKTYWGGGGNFTTVTEGSGKNFQISNFSGASSWVGAHLVFGDTSGPTHLWVDGSGKLRIKSGAPTSDTDGTVVGTQT